MKISFYQDDSVLGVEEYTDIEEILLPAYEAGAHDIYLKKKFVAHEGNNWLVINLEFEHPEAKLFLKHVPMPHSVATYAKGQKQKISKYLLKNRIIEVDFGFYSNQYKGDGQLKNNLYNTSTLIQGEMQKKRPCIVVGTHRNLVEVIPLSTQDDVKASQRVIQLEANSFNNMAEKYRSRTSFAILDMIQVVSSERAFPPLSQLGKYHDHYHKYKLSSIDITAINSALSDKYGSSISHALALAKQQLENVKHEKMRLIEKNKELVKQAELNSVVNKDNEMLIKEVAEEFEIDIKKSISEIKSELRGVVIKPTLVDK